MRSGPEGRGWINRGRDRGPETSSPDAVTVAGHRLLLPDAAPVPAHASIPGLLECLCHSSSIISRRGVISELGRLQPLREMTSAACGVGRNAITETLAVGCPVSAFIEMVDESEVLPDEESRTRHAPSEVLGALEFVRRHRLWRSLLTAADCGLPRPSYLAFSRYFKKSPLVPRSKTVSSSMVDS